MKKFIVLGLLLLTAMGCDSQNVTVEGKVMDEKSYDGRWAYLICMYDAQADIIDSCMIENNKYILSGKLPFNDEMLGEVVIENAAQSISLLRLVHGQHLIADFDPKSTDIYPNVTGSSASEELYANGQYIKRIFKEHINPLRNQQKSLSPEAPAYIVLQDSIKQCNSDIDAEVKKMFDQTQSPLNAITAYFYLQTVLQADTLKSMLDDLQHRFPKNINLTMITGDSIAPMTPRSQWVYNRRALLMGNVSPYPDTMKEVGDAEGITEISDVTEIQGPPSQTNNDSGYAIGDVVEDLQLPGNKSEESLYAIKTPYTLIDFWASWCGPCREEVPAIKRSAAEYSDLLSIYAISIDSNLNQWRDAIEKDGSEKFIHVILRNDNPDFDKIKKMFNIQQIPANFLLDKNHRIIAVNLRGEDLNKKLQELMSESSSKILVE